jgi:DNA-binding XRE family transcriptional regulator
MLAHTRKHHTEEAVEIRFIGPKSNRYKACDALSALGFHAATDLIPARELFPDSTDEQMPGRCLSGARYREGITQKQLSEMTGIPQAHISAMENGKRPIGKKTARLFGAALNLNWKVFL